MDSFKELLQRVAKCHEDAKFELQQEVSKLQEQVSHLRAALARAGPGFPPTPAPAPRLSQRSQGTGRSSQRVQTPTGAEPPKGHSQWARDSTTLEVLAPRAPSQRSGDKANRGLPSTLIPAPNASSPWVHEKASLGPHSAMPGADAPSPWESERASPRSALTNQRERDKAAVGPSSVPLAAPQARENGGDDEPAFTSECSSLSASPYRRVRTAEAMMTPAERWASLINNMLYGTHRLSGFRRRDDPLFELLPHWTLLNQVRPVSSSFGVVSLRARGMFGRDSSDYILQQPSLHGLVLSPTSHKRLLWCMLGVLLLSWDTLIIPLQVFNLGLFYEVVRIVGVMTSVYWVLDMPFQCFIGFQHPDGTEERRPSRIARHYLRTWFALDLSIVLVDSVLLLAIDKYSPQEEPSESGNGSSVLQASGRSLRLARLVRLLRLVRLMRLRKLNELMTLTLFRIKSEHLILGIKLAKHVGMIMLVNHYIACAWYALAVFNEDGETWLSASDQLDSSMQHHYVMALHWSMTQFSPATNNISPQNWHERVFAVIVVLFALIMFSSFISSVTNTVNQLRTLNLEPQMEEVRIREFLFAHKVSPDLVGRILNFFKQNYRGTRQRLHEADIAFFQDVPESMKIRLHEEAFMPILSANPMFQSFVHLDRPLLVQICHIAFSECFYLPQQDVFVDGTLALAVHYVSSGRLLYHSLVHTTVHQVKVGPGDWISEMALWVSWYHCGQLGAESSCELLVLDRAEFTAIVSKAGGPLIECLRRFAVFILGHAETSVLDMPVTDVCIAPPEEMQALAARAKRLWELQTFGPTRGKSVVWQERKTLFLSTDK
mmetsp:Transcript_83646/g.194482  ORF Transcript_83646/g.194482 Transcript_83646/m.194482 type:complete len:831 (-) Transcript_83646:93-2585(-)